MEEALENRQSYIRPHGLGPKASFSVIFCPLFRKQIDFVPFIYSLAVDPDNQFFVSGAADRTIKLWSLGSGELKITLTGHISAVRGLEVSKRHPYLFSCGEDVSFIPLD